MENSRRRVGAALLTGLAVLGAPELASTQPSAKSAVAESASVARTAWARGLEAWRKEDMSTARLEIDRAAHAWPVQPAYLWGRVAIAVRARDTAAVLDALTSYADLGLGRDLTSDSMLASFARLPRFRQVAAAHDANRTPVVRSRTRATLPDSTFWAEGMDFDPRTGRFYVASIRHRTIAEISTGGTTRELWPRAQAGFGAVLGVRVDTARRVLWATLGGIPQMGRFVPNDTMIASLVRVRMSDGAIEKRWDLPPTPRGHTLGDLAIGPGGDVFVTDSNDPSLYRLRPNADTLERITSPFFYSLQGVAPTPDGRALYLADYSHGLLRMDLATGAVIRLPDAPHSTSVGCDGIAWDRGSIIAVQNGVAPARVMRFVLDLGGTRIVRAELLDRNSDVADEPTIGAIVGREFVYVANSAWDKHDARGNVSPNARLARPVLLAVPLDAR